MPDALPVTYDPAALRGLVAVPGEAREGIHYILRVGPDADVTVARTHCREARFLLLHGGELLDALEWYATAPTWVERTQARKRVRVLVEMCRGRPEYAAKLAAEEPIPSPVVVVGDQEQE